MNEFLNVAKSLEVKEISKDVDNSDNHVKTPEENNAIVEEEIVKATDYVPEKIVGTHNSKQNQINSDKNYPCDQCNYIAPAPSKLLRHTQSIHNGVKYPCNQCTYKATQKFNL